MPTGYTADVGTGKVTDFAEFAMQCARAFGACVTMRDDPSDAIIPDEFKPSSHHADRLAEAKAELSCLQGMTVDQQEVAARDAYEQALAYQKRYRREKEEQRARYEAMLDKVAGWSPPTADHVEMKKFMREQLRTSIDFDCGGSYEPEAKKLSRSEWHAEAIKKAEHDVTYHADEHRKEVERAINRTAWVKALRASLAAKSE